MNRVSAGLVARLDGVSRRVDDHGRSATASGRLTAADPPTGERWEEGQVWAHLAEFIPYWVGEATRVIERSGAGEPPGFGRTKTDPARIAAIERDRGSDRPALWHRVSADIATLRAWISGVPEPTWRARGVHPTRGEMTLEQLVDEFLVAHLEEHASQLDEIRA